MIAAKSTLIISTAYIIYFQHYMVLALPLPPMDAHAGFFLGWGDFEGRGIIFDKVLKKQVGYLEELRDCW